MDDTARKALQDLWIAGTMGAYFAALSRAAPVQLSELSTSPDFGYTFVQIIRYGYLFWFLVYFFASHAKNKADGGARINGRDLGYDVVQSTLALSAGYFLGFTVPGTNFDLAVMVAVANAAIAVICILALFFWSENTGAVKIPRLWGGIVAGLAAAGSVIVYCRESSDSLVFKVGALSALLIVWALLLVFVRHRLRRSHNLEAERPPAVDQGGGSG